MPARKASGTHYMALMSVRANAHRPCPHQTNCWRLADPPYFAERVQEGRPIQEAISPRSGAVGVNRVHKSRALQDRDGQYFQVGLNIIAAAIPPATDNRPQNSRIRLSPIEGPEPNATRS